MAKQVFCPIFTISASFFRSARAYYGITIRINFHICFMYRIDIHHIAIKFMDIIRIPISKNARRRNCRSLAELTFFLLRLSISDAKLSKRTFRYKKNCDFFYDFLFFCLTSFIYFRAKRMFSLYRSLCAVKNVIKKK